MCPFTLDGSGRMQKIIKFWIKGSILLLSACLLASCTKMAPPTSGFGNPAKAKQYQNPSDLWQSLGSSFDLPDESTSNPAVRYEINWYMQHPYYIIKMAEQAKPYLYYIFQQAKKHHLPTEIVLIPMVESAYNPFAINNSSGAAGLWQMMPSTASGFGLHMNWWYDGRRDVLASTSAAMNYFSYLGSFFHNNWLLAIAAYDTGEGNVQQAINRNAKAGKSISFWALRLPKETQSYVPKILALATIISHPYQYPINLPYIPNAPYLAKINIGTQIDLARAASMAGLSLKELTSLNPGYNRWATDPNGKHILLLPMNKLVQFKKALRRLPVKDRVTWHRVNVKSGDTLDGIAHRYKTSVRLITQVNHIKHNLIHPGQTLLIPSQTSPVTKLVIKNERRYFKSLHAIPEPKIIHHIVKRGESLWAVAHRYHVSINEIRFWNHFRGKHVAPGTRLTIWPPHKQVHLYYTSWPYRVHKGDSLLAISHRYHVPLLVLKKANNLKGDIIHVGQLMRIPVAHYTAKKHHHTARKKTVKHSSHQTMYRVRSGDTLFEIAKRFHVSARSIRVQNHLKNSELRAGQVLTVDL
jgi:membrane-bound lytic murein transglycosylase D